MTALVPAGEFTPLFLNGTPFIDVRAELEFDRGAFPAACNMPILTTGERSLVGTVYKQQGRLAAVSLGHELVQGDLKSARIAAVRSVKTTCTTSPGGSSSCCWIARSAPPGVSNANANLSWKQNRRQLSKMISNLPSVRHPIWR